MPGSMQGLGQRLQLCPVSPLSAGKGMAALPHGTTTHVRVEHDSFHPGQVQISPPVCTQLLAIAACAGISLLTLVYGKHKVA